MACRAKPSSSGSVTRDDLHHAAVDETLDALPDRGLGQADDLADGGVRAASVLLELLDDRLRDVVEGDPCALRLPVHAQMLSRQTCPVKDFVGTASIGFRCALGNHRRFRL